MSSLTQIQMLHFQELLDCFGIFGWFSPFSISKHRVRVWKVIPYQGILALATFWTNFEQPVSGSDEAVLNSYTLVLINYKIPFLITSHSNFGVQKSKPKCVFEYLPFSYTLAFQLCPDCTYELWKTITWRPGSFWHSYY